MAQCPKSNERLFGGAVVLEVADGCSDKMPAEADWLSLAAGTSKGWDFGPNTVTSDADDGAGYVESIVTNSDFTISFEGEVRKADRLDQYGIGKFIKYFAAELQARRQPGLWVRLEYGPVTFIGYMVITALSSDGGTNDIVTFSTEFKVGDASTIQVIDSNPITFTTNLPASKVVALGANVDLTVAAVASGTTQPTIAWYKDGQLMANKTGDTLSITSAKSTDAGEYKAVATLVTGGTTTTRESNSLVLTVS